MVLYPNGAGCQGCTSSVPLAAARRPGPADPAQNSRCRLRPFRRERLRRDHHRHGRRNGRCRPETIYLSVGGKRGLLEGVIDSAIAGDESQVADDQRFWDDVALLPTARERLDKMVEYSCRILARTRPIHAVIRGAADSEAFAAALGRRRLQGRLEAQTQRIERYLADDLRPGLSISEAGERYCVLASPDLYYLLTVDMGWSADRHRRWLGELARDDLLASR